MKSLEATHLQAITSRSALALLGVAVLGLSATNAKAATLYANGVSGAANLSYSTLLSDGWTSLVDVTYGTALNHNDIASWQATIGSGYVFVGALDSVTGKIVVGATGLASEVLDQTSSSLTAVTYGSSNLRWYNVSNLSFGFTPTSNIDLNAADTTGILSSDDGNNDLRLSWHDSIGGWRAGAIAGLNDDTKYHKVVLYGSGPSQPQSVPDGGSTIALLGLAVTAVFGARRKSGI